VHGDPPRRRRRRGRRQRRRHRVLPGHHAPGGRACGDTRDRVSRERASPCGRHVDAESRDVEARRCRRPGRAEAEPGRRTAARHPCHTRASRLRGGRWRPRACERPGRGSARAGAGRRTRGTGGRPTGQRFSAAVEAGASDGYARGVDGSRSTAGRSRSGGRPVAARGGGRCKGRP
jgi:hypothetical protein